MGLGFSFGPRIARVRISSRGVRAYGSVGVGGLSYGWRYGGSGGGSRGGSGGGGGGGTRTVYVERLTAKEIREAAEEEARQDAARKERREADREERRLRWEKMARESARRHEEADRRYAERIAEIERDAEERERQWEAEEAEENARREREEAEEHERENVEGRAEQKARVKKWVGHAKREGATHATIWFSYADSHKKDTEVSVPLDQTWRTVKEKAPTGLGFRRDEPVISIVGTLDGQWCTDFC